MYDQPLEGFEVDVPADHREAAEAIRAHLVSHRGGAVFLSSADALRLLDWLDRGIPTATVLRAIERAADHRQKSRSRIPLGLGHVSRHLDRPTRGLFKSPPELASSPGPVGLDPLVRAIRERAAEDRLGTRLLALAEELAGLGPPKDVASEAMVRVRAFHDAVYDALGHDRRHALRAAATADLGDLVHLLDEGDQQLLVEENARHAAREGYAWLSCATVWDLLAAKGDS